jgi:DNA repair exonuclease SbcCD ATPase subunit
VQAAQESVKQNANTVLESLSGGAFQIELEESASGEELQILVRDANTQNANDKARAFEFFSGGEGLLIAVSLAIAIGQAVAGRTAANTLIIDEGFGALDNNRRELLVEELGRLSRDVLQGGRVIVVSHQDDVKEKFGNRFLLGKTGSGLTSVDLYGKV